MGEIEKIFDSIAPFSKDVPKSNYRYNQSAETIDLQKKQYAMIQSAALLGKLQQEFH